MDGSLMALEHVCKALGFSRRRYRPEGDVFLLNIELETDSKMRLCINY